MALSFLSLSKHRSVLMRMAIVTCTRINRRFLYSDATRGEFSSGQHSKYLHILIVSPKKYRACRFLLGWLFLHRRLRSRQRGSNTEVFERRRSPFGCTFPKGVTCFYPSNLKKSEDFFWAKPFGFDARRQWQILSVLILPSNNASPPLFAYPCTGQKPVSVFDCERDSTSIFLNVKKKIL